jgi:carbon storage regulator CsrA
MLIISRKKDQKIIIADEIEITILEVGRNRVRFGIKAPKHIAINTRIKTTSDQVGQVIDMQTRTTLMKAVPAVAGLANGQ